MIPIGFSGRFFPDNFRPVEEEAAFACDVGFECIQFAGKEEGLGADHLGVSLSDVRAILDNFGLAAMMEIMIRVGDDGLSA